MTIAVDLGRKATKQTNKTKNKSLEYAMTVKLLAKHHLEFLSLKGGCTSSYESTLVKIPHCWKSCIAAHIYLMANFSPF